MNLCSSCNYQNRVGELFCQDCGNPLFDGGSIKQGGSSSDTRSTRQLNVVVPQMQDTPIWMGTTQLTPTTTVLLRFKNSVDPLVLSGKTEMLVGRSDTKTNHYPDIDLTPYGALDEGVSRVHARLKREDANVTISDMDSVNGTYVNGQRLDSGMDRILRDGDELRFGRLIAHIYFKA